MKAKLTQMDRNTALLGIPENSDLQSFVTSATLSVDGLRAASLMEMMVRQAPLAMMVCDEGQRITLANVAARRMAQTDPEGRSLEDAPSIWGEMFDLGHRRVPAEEWPCMRALHGEVTIEHEFHMVRSDRSAYDVLFTASPIKSARERIVGAVTTLLDISDRKFTELMVCHEAVSRERDRMAAEIHDTLCQSVSAIVLQLRAAEDAFLEDVQQARQHFHRAHDIARETLVEARRSIWLLSDERTQGEDLPTALSCLAERLFASTPVRVELSIPAQSCVLSPEVSRELLYIAKEALTNVVKHAQATTVRIKLIYSPLQVQLSISDNGHGFVRFRSPTSQPGFGLIGMQKRAKWLGGKVVIHRRPGKGTRVIALAPLRHSSLH